MKQMQTWTIQAHKVIEILTVPPVFALVALTLIYSIHKRAFGGKPWYLAAVLFLVAIPASPYIVSLIPSLQVKDRTAERRLAFWVGVPSYGAGTFLSYMLNAPNIVKAVFLSYLWSGLSLSFINAVLKFRASGHACGVAGPLALLIRFVGASALLLSVILPLVFWSRLRLGRHTLPELLAGAAIGLGATTAVLLAVSL